jgi:hypothetical protein
VPKGRGGPEERVRYPRVARFGALQASLPRSEQQDPGTSSSPPLARPGDEHTCPAASKWLKSSLMKLSDFIRARSEVTTFAG